MKKIVILASLLFVAAAPALAIEKITFPNRLGEVVFPHKKHQDALNECRRCHPTGVGRIPGFGKVMAHAKGCKGCHEEMKRGPVVCKGCHSKPE